MIRRDQISVRALGSAVGLLLLGLVALLLPAPQASAQGVPPTCPSSLGTATIISNDFNVSFCELCDVGTVRIVVENPFRRTGDDIDFSEIVVTQNLRASGLTYVDGSTRFSGSNIAVPPEVEPTESGPGDSILTWTLSSGFIMDAYPGGTRNRRILTIEFEVERNPIPSVTEEDLVRANRTISASVELTPSCAPTDRFTSYSTPGTLPLNEPEPQLRKAGRNVDAAQGGYSSTVYGHENDDVIWRIRVQNNGDAPLQDFQFSDSIVPGNFEFDYVCDTEGDATSVATGGAPGDCFPVGGVTEVLDLDVALRFGDGANPYIVAPAGGRRFYYFVGKITDSCTNRGNTVFDGAWGCQVEPPPGGITQTSNGATAGSDRDMLRTLSVESGVNVNVSLTGVNTGQPMGGTGTVTIEISNQSSGTIRAGLPGFRLRDVLPAEYVIDSTFVPTVVTTPAYGDYLGMVDTVRWVNFMAGTVPLTTTDPALPLSNTDLQFVLSSSTEHPDYPGQHMIRHGDVVTVTFRTVLIDPQYYDKVANLDVRTEAPSSDPPGTDPTESFSIHNHLEIWFEEFCTANEHHLTLDEDFEARPEDLDANIVGNELLFVLTATGDPLRLSVALTNNGGHDASQYLAYVTFGEAMVVQSAPGAYAPLGSLPAPLVWRLPADIPATASVYVCDGGGDPIGPGTTELLEFDVVKNTALSFDDDLTFRADVIGEITLSDNTPLWFPTPTPRVDGVTDNANDYSLDGLRARVIGYDLLKSQLGICSENHPPPNDPDVEVQIGEECSYHVESGGWFGFQTPGFTYIAVQDIQVVDGIPDGQGYISSTDPLLQSTPAIMGVLLNPPPEPLSEDWFDWTFNTDEETERIREKDHWFRVNVTTRLLNDLVDESAPPNEHAAISSNVLTSTFEAVFYNPDPVIDDEEVYTVSPSTVGFPNEVHRRVDLTVTEPHLIVTKEVCNETRYGAGAACSNFVTLADDGDAFDTYVYRVTVTNEADSDGVTRAPAYEVTVTSVTDPSDELFVDPLTSDTLDNDGDALVDAGDAAGEGQITDNTVLNGLPAEVIASYTHSDALLRLDAGESVVLYYRVDPDDNVAPLQQLTSSVSASYDSLEGASGNQSAPLGLNGELAGARQYVSDSAEATIEIIPVLVAPKQIVRVSNSGLVAPANPQPVSIGEEIEFQLRTLIPVAQLRSFVVRDELPEGLSCTEAPAVDLNAPPYDAAGFTPGGVFTPTCTETEVIWDFGNQIVTQSPRVDRRFDFGMQFIARVDNIDANREDVVIRNGGSATVTTVSYVDEAGNDVVLSIPEAAVVVREPVMELTKAFSVVEVDAGDVPRVTVTATNIGTTTAYNLRVLDDLSAAGLSFRDDVTGSDPPAADIAMFGADSPVFSWPLGFGIAPGETISFSFAVHVDGLVEPLELFLNTVEADWTSLPDRDTALNSTGEIGPDGSATGMRNGALPNSEDPLNNYEAQASASIAVPGITVDKIDVDPALDPEIGAHKPFEVLIELPEGMTRDLIVSDDLDSGTVSYVLANNADFDVSYEFVGISTINGQAPGEAAFAAVPVDGTVGTAVWSVGTVVTATEDDLITQAVNPAIRVHYYARINNDLATNAGSTLQNSVVMNYINGETGGQESETDATAAIVARESLLTATKLLTNVSPGKAAGDPPAVGDILQYVVTVINGGDATAYDVNVVDTLPVELVLYGSFTPTAEINGAPVLGFVGTPAGAPAGPLVWGRGNGDLSLDIPAGRFLELTYRVVLATPTPDPTQVENNVRGDWTSLEAESPYERTGDGCPNITPPNDYCFGPASAIGTTEPVDTADALQKENTQADAAVGEAFRYRVTVPATPYAFPMYDVRIHDDLTASAAVLRFVSVAKISGSGPWTPVNTGTATNLVIEDPATGIDIAAGEQIVVEITVVLEDVAQNWSGLTFTNTAWYFYNWVDGDDASQRPGDPGTTESMTIVGADVLTMEKRGPASMTIGTPETFTLDVLNGSEGPAWNLTILDQLPNTAGGGTCDIPPSQVTARVFELNGTTPVSDPLVEGTDFSVGFVGDPTCELSVTLLSATAVIDADQRLIVTYEASLDVDSQDGAALTNIAGASEWFSADGSDPNTVDDRRTYTRTLTDGTVGVVDHEDAHTVLVSLPRYAFEKTASNVTSGGDPATDAEPGDRLRYRLRVENLGDTPISNFNVFDELDRLNSPAAFEPGTLTLLTVPGGADRSNTSSTGGASGSGVLDIRDLSLPGLNDSLLIEFEITLAPVIADGTYVTNQAQLRVDDVAFADSDDPNVNGPADPLVPGDEDPTRVLIQSEPDFQVEKTSSYVTGDPSVLLAGETLRYTITVKNIGTDNAVDAVLRDDIPVNTQYVAGSTTLNGAPVADGPLNSAPFIGGIPIYAPEDPTPGVMRADVSPTAGNEATLVFDVVVDGDVIDGTVISNQALVSAVGGGVVDDPSDDPRTAIPNDPTRDVVGNAPLLFAAKDVALVVDAGTVGLVDPLDVLRYTITVYNSGGVPASGTALRDDVPTNATYVGGSLTLNGLPAGQPDGGVSPLVAGIPISSADLTPPLPVSGMGAITPGETAVVQFDLRVNAGVPGGTIISNQAVLISDQVPNLLTDGDGDPATGPEPTLVVVGDGQQLSITKQVAVVGGGVALAGSQLEYVVRVVNVAAVPALDVVITDDLDAAGLGQLAYVPSSATMNGSTAGVSVVGSILTADYSGLNGPLEPGESIVLRFRAVIDASLAMGTTVPNTGVVGWNTPQQTASARVSVDVGGMPGVGILNGALWHDADFDTTLGGTERLLGGWIVNLYRNGQPVQSVLTGASGTYRMSGLEPNDVTGDRYELRFSAPDAGANTAALGRGDSPFTNGPQTITDIVVPSGSNLQDLNLPIQPNGVAYGAIQRVPMAGATLTLLNASGSTPVPSVCFDDPAQQGQVTRSDGYYKFDLNFSDAACPNGGNYLIAVVAPGSGGVAGYSQIIPPSSDATTVPLSVPTCPGGPNDAVPSTSQYCEIQPSEFAPSMAVPAGTAGTNYHVHLTLDDSQVPGSSQIFNNHIPLDPVLDSTVAVTKTTPLVNVSIGQLVPYEITVSNQLDVELSNLRLVDRFPAGFRYVEGSARLDGEPTEPAVDGRELVWSELVVPSSSRRSLVLLLAVGAGVSEGEYVNRVQAISDPSGVLLSGEATATVRVVPDPTFACTDVLGKVFDDANRNGSQDEGEEGLPGIKLVTARGLVASTDQY